MVRIYQCHNQYANVVNFFFITEHLNETIVILALVYLGGAFAALVRAWLFTLAGQRLVARIRKKARIFLYII